MSDKLEVPEIAEAEEGQTPDQPLSIPPELPILPLRDTVLFPNSFMPLAVARESSIQLIDDAVAAGRLAVDGQTIGAMNSEAVQARRRLTKDGLASATLVISANGRLAAPLRVALWGLPELSDGESVTESAIHEIERALTDMPPGAGDEELLETARRALRRLVKTHLGKRPVIDVSVIRLDSEAVETPRRVSAGS